MMAAANFDLDLSGEPTIQLEENFNKATNYVRRITNNLNNEQLLEFYGLYKQSTEGNCNIPRPGWFDGKGRHKWDAWKSKCNLTSDEAKEQYIELLQELDPNFVVESKYDKESWAAVSSLKKPQEEELDLEDMSVLELARDNHSSHLEKVLEEEPELAFKKDDSGLTILHWAADRDATEALVIGIEAGCELDAMDNEGQTALHYAVFCGHAEATRILLNAGASKEMKDATGNTPRDLADNDNIRELFEVSYSEF